MGMKPGKAPTEKVLVVLSNGGVGEDGDPMTLLRDEDGRELGYLFDDTAKKLGLPTVGGKGKMVAWLLIQVVA